MPSTAINRLELLLQGKKLDRTLMRAWLVDSGWTGVPSGIPELDRQLGGGWRRGEVSELYGARSSGRTSVLLSTLASSTRRGDIVGLVDALDRFDPASAAAAGVDLDRMLWVRGAPVADALRRAIRALDLIVRAGGFGVVALDAADIPARCLRSLPWTTWMRLAQANEGRDTVCLLAGEAAMGRSARGASVRLEASARWIGDSPQRRRFDGFTIRTHVARSSLAAAPCTLHPAPCTPPAPSTLHPAPCTS